MNGSWRLAACAIGVLILACLPSAPAAEPTEKGWIDFVTGKDLSFWKTYVPPKDSLWRVEDGVLVCETGENSPKSRIRSQVQGKWDDLPWGHFMDVEIELDVRFTGDVDASIAPRKGGLKFWLGSCGRDPENRTGCWYTGETFPESGRAQNVDKVWKKDDWNSVRILAKGDKFTAWINGQKVSEFEGEEGAFPHNHVDVRTGPGKKMKLEIRNFRARPL